MAVAPYWVIEELTGRCAEGPVELSKPALCPSDPVRVLGGPFQPFEAIFDGYLGGTERVAVLLSIMSAERRLVMAAAMVRAR